MNTKKIGNVIYNTFFAIILIIALLLVVSIFPITGNYQVLVVKSGSMEPSIKTGALLVTKPADEYIVGDIITFQGTGSDPTPITHRIHDIRLQEGRQVYITKGDANNATDQREILAREIIGKYVFSIPYIGYVVDAARSPVGFILIIVIPATIIVYDELVKIKKEVSKMKKKKNKTDDKQDHEIDDLEEEIDELRDKIDHLDKEK